MHAYFHGIKFINKWKRFCRLSTGDHRNPFAGIHHHLYLERANFRPRTVSYIICLLRLAYTVRHTVAFYHVHFIFFVRFHVYSTF